MPRFLCALLAAASALSACGGGAGGTSGSGATVRLQLEAAPSGVHSGAYLAISRGYDDATGIELRILTPPPRADGVRALLEGEAEVAVMALNDFGRAVASGDEVVAVMALVQRPLEALLAAPGVQRPRALSGGVVGAAGPAGAALARAVVKDDGGAAPRARIVEDPLRALNRNRVRGAMGRWDTLGSPRPGGRPVREFRVADHGAPGYPGLVLVTTRSTLDERRADVSGIVEALQRGYEEAVIDPESAVGAIADGEPGSNRAALAEQLDRVAPVLLAGQRDFGRFNPEALRGWAAYALRIGILERPVDVAEAFDTTLVRRADR